MSVDIVCDCMVVSQAAVAGPARLREDIPAAAVGSVGLEHRLEAGRWALVSVVIGPAIHFAASFRSRGNVHIS